MLESWGWRVRRAFSAAPNRVAIVLTLLLGVALFAAALLRAPARDLLIDWTGETELKAQAVALASSLVQRQVDTADLTPMRYSGVAPFGANTFFEQEVEESKLRRSMEMLRAAGVRWVRQQIPWADIEPSARGEYRDRQGKSTWGKYDRIVRLAHDYDLEILARLDLPPSWSRRDNSYPFAPPDNFDDYGNFVETFVRRYRGQIRYYQIWNEPNTELEWGNRPIDAAEYVRLLQIAYTKAKAADPSAVIVAAALAPTLGTPDGRNVSDLPYLQDMYDAGARDYFDVMGVMAYGLWTGPGDRRTSPRRTNFSRPELIREIMVRNGDAAKPIWASELGWNALPAGFPTPATHGRVSEADQARYTARAYGRALDEWPWVGVLFYWYFRPVDDHARDQVLYYFRMVDPDFTARPVYHAYREVATAEPTVRYGARRATDGAIRASNGWKEVGTTGRREAAAPGEWLEFTFRGTALDLRALRTDRGARLGVSIDDEPGRFGDVDLGATVEEPVQVPLARGLAGGEHRARIVVATPGRAAVDGVVVYRDPAPVWQGAVGAFIALAAIVAAAGAVTRSRNRGGS